MRRAAAAALLVLALIAHASGGEPSPFRPVPAEEFRPVLTSPPQEPTSTPAATPQAVLIDPRAILPSKEPPARSSARPPTAAPASEPKATAATGRSRRGTATWYCLTGVSRCHYAYSGGMYAAAGSELRVGDWRGRKVTVCRGDACIRVTLIDWCACAGERIIDLYGDAFRALAPLSKGTIKVTVRW